MSNFRPRLPLKFAWTLDTNHETKTLMHFIGHHNVSVEHLEIIVERHFFQASRPVEHFHQPRIEFFLCMTDPMLCNKIWD